MALSRPLGENEAFAYNWNKQGGNLNVTMAITLLSEHPIDEGIMKISLQEFQHMFPQLTTRIRTHSSINNNIHNQDHHQSSNEGHQMVKHFVPMECPTLPLDSAFCCKDMIHEKFNTEVGPLWRVQLVDESSMDLANLKFGPELAAIVEDDSADQPTRWRHFLRYNQGHVNQVL